jgi:hypothetical protein
MAAAKSKEISHGFKNGDILVCSWGYDQTNVDFYQVTRILPKSIEIRAIDKHYEEKGYMCGDSIPLPGIFKSGKRVVRVKKYRDTEFVGLSSFESAYKWDGNPKYTSYYA